MVEFLDEKKFWKARDALEQEAASRSTKRHDDWLRFHEAVIAVAARFGKVTDHWEGGDFYHTLDWSHSLVGGLTLRTAKPLFKLKLAEFQRVVVQTSPSALLTIAGEFYTPIEKLEIAVHPKALLVTWRGMEPDAARKHLHTLGFKVETQMA
jgi:hypothetical protein